MRIRIQPTRLRIKPHGSFVSLHSSNGSLRGSFTDQLYFDPDLVIVFLSDSAPQNSADPYRSGSATLFILPVLWALASNGNFMLWSYLPLTFWLPVPGQYPIRIRQFPLLIMVLLTESHPPIIMIPFFFSSVAVLRIRFRNPVLFDPGIQDGK